MGPAGQRTLKTDEVDYPLAYPPTALSQSDIPSLRTHLSAPEVGGSQLHQRVGHLLEGAQASPDAPLGIRPHVQEIAEYRCLVAGHILSGEKGWGGRGFMERRGGWQRTVLDELTLDVRKPFGYAHHVARAPRMSDGLQLPKILNKPKCATKTVIFGHQGKG